MLDDILDYTANLRHRPVWQPIPQSVRQRFHHSTLPAAPTPLADVHNEFLDFILPYAVGNAHPGFLGWVHGGGTPVGMLAEMLAAGLNANLGGRDQIPIAVERQITRWMQSLFAFPESSAGLFVTGASMANFIAVVVARDAALGDSVRKQGVRAPGASAQRPASSASPSSPLTAYASAAVHRCVPQALDLCGLGSDALRQISTDPRHRIDLAALASAIQKDRASGHQPFLLIATAGTVDTGAVDNLSALADLAHREHLHFHVDGACGALAMLAPDLAPKLRGIERADSIAFDFHKWGQVPYDAGFILVRDGQLQRNAFAASSVYLRRETRGLAAGSDWPCDYGPDLSRGFRALKTWFTLKVYGANALGNAISHTCALARYLEQRIAAAPELELLAPVELNIVCFRYRSEHSDRVNAEIVVELHESGLVAPSTTYINGRLAIRAAIVNHRTTRADLDMLLRETVARGRAKSSGSSANAPVALTPEIVPAQSAVSGPRPKWEAELREVESQLAANPASVPLLFRRAELSAELGRLVAAGVGYIKVLEREPCHRTAINNLGSVLTATGHLSAARLAFKEAVTRHPSDAVSHVNFGGILLEQAERLAVRPHSGEPHQLRREARDHFEQALLLSPGNEKAHEGLCYVFHALGDEPRATWHRHEAFRNRFLIPRPYRGAVAPIRVLQFVSTTGGNVRLQHFLDDRIFQNTLVLPEFYNPQTPLPPHDLVINGIGDAEVASPALQSAQSLLALTSAPVINPPAAVLATTRTANAQRLANLPGVITPRTAIVPRADLTTHAQAATTLSRLGFTLPVLLRAPGFHTGQHFSRVDSLDDLPAAASALPSPEIIVMQYLDARAADGKSRKYRVMFIDGQIYPLHVAISAHWKIHYFTAEMANNAEHRAADAAFLENMPAILGPTAMRALELIQSALALDYAGIDFGLSPHGELLLFEANATMVANPPEPGDLWAYRLPACTAIHNAVNQMFRSRATLAQSQPSAPSQTAVARSA